jgi:hypothetical protein
VIAVQPVTDADGDRLLLVERRGETSLVRDPETGMEDSRPTATLTPVEESPLSVAAEGVTPPVRRTVLACRDDRALGLLVELVDRGPTAAETLTDGYDLCESDLNGVLSEFRAAGLVTRTTVAGLPGYEPTAEAEAVLDRFR